MKVGKEICKKIVNEINEGCQICAICKRYNISKATVYNYLSQDKRLKGCKDITYNNYVALQRELLKVKLEIEIYENLHCFKDATTKEKEIAISKYVGVYPIKTMCRVLDISKGTFYNYHLIRKQITQYQIRNEQLKQEIYKIFKDSGERFGAKKIEAKLRANGIKTTLHKVQTLMKLLNIKSTQQINKIEESRKDIPQYYVNKLKRLFNQDAPNKYWTSDITEIRVGRNKFYICAILDLFSRKVIAYRLSSQNNTQLTINTFKDAFESRNRPNDLSFHSDQGSNYTAYEFRDLLHSLKVNQSFLKAGNPYDNACMESFFSSFKREEYNSKIYEYFDELEVSVDSFIKYYNEYRPRQTLKNKTPNQFEEEYLKQIDNKKATN